MSKIRIINIKDNRYKTIRLISKRFKVKYYDPPVSDTIIEFCIQIKGEVIARPDNQVNKNMATGEVEVLAKELHIYNASDVLPLDFNQNNTEEQRLKYRYLDLRRPEMAQRLKTRAKITSFVRRFMDDNGFLNIETTGNTKLFSSLFL